MTFLLMVGCGGDRPVPAQAGMRLIVPHGDANFAADLDGDGHAENRLEKVIWALFAWHLDVQAACDHGAAGFDDKILRLPLVDNAPPLALSLTRMQVGDGQINGLAGVYELAEQLSPLLGRVIARDDQAGRLIGEELDIGGCAPAHDGRVEACELLASPLGRELLQPDIDGGISVGVGFTAW